MLPEGAGRVACGRAPSGAGSGEGGAGDGSEVGPALPGVGGSDRRGAAGPSARCLGSGGSAEGRKRAGVGKRGQ